MSNHRNRWQTTVYASRNVSNKVSIDSIVSPSHVTPVSQSAAGVNIITICIQSSPLVADLKYLWGKSRRQQARALFGPVPAGPHRSLFDVTSGDATTIYSSLVLALPDILRAFVRVRHCYQAEQALSFEQ